MEIFIYALFGLMLGFNVYLIIKLQKLEKKLDQKSSEHQKKLADAGNAFVDTIKIAFDNIKMLTHGQDKIKKDMKEHTAKIDQYIRSSQIEEARQRYKENTSAKENKMR